MDELAILNSNVDSVETEGFRISDEESSSSCAA